MEERQSSRLPTTTDAGNPRRGEAMISAESPRPTSLKASVFTDQSGLLDDGSTGCGAVSIPAERRSFAADVAFGAVDDNQELQPVDSKGFSPSVRPLPIALFTVRRDDERRITTGKIQLHPSYLFRHRRGARGYKHDEIEGDSRLAQGRETGARLDDWRGSHVATEGVRRESAGGQA
jgi:hypothetical protein